MADKPDYYDVSWCKPGEDGKTHFVKIGRGFPNDNGRIDIVFDALPLMGLWDGRLCLFPHAKGVGEPSPPKRDPGPGRR
jgi:hypothetical protein